MLKHPSEHLVSVSFVSLVCMNLLISVLINSKMFPTLSESIHSVFESIQVSVVSFLRESYHQTL